MTADETKTLRRLVENYEEARSQHSRMSVGGTVLSLESNARWSLVNAQHALAEWTAKHFGSLK